MPEDSAQKSSSRSALVWLSIPAVVAVLLACFCVALTVRHGKGNALQTALVRVPKGASVAAADQLMGGPPDDVWKMSGVLVNGVTMLDASNSEAPKHGSPANFEIRRWKRGDVYAFLFVAEDGTIAGRTAVRDSLARRWLPPSWQSWPP